MEIIHEFRHAFYREYRNIASEGLFFAYFLPHVSEAEGKKRRRETIMRRENNNASVCASNLFTRDAESERASEPGIRPRVPWFRCYSSSVSTLVIELHGSCVRLRTDCGHAIAFFLPSYREMYHGGAQYFLFVKKYHFRLAIYNIAHA